MNSVPVHTEAGFDRPDGLPDAVMARQLSVTGLCSPPTMDEEKDPHTRSSVPVQRAVWSFIEGGDPAVEKRFQVPAPRPAGTVVNVQLWSPAIALRARSVNVEPFKVNVYWAPCARIGRGPTTIFLCALITFQRTTVSTEFDALSRKLYKPV